MPGSNDISLSERRLVENEVIFKSVNKNIKEFVTETRADINKPIKFYCECSNTQCTERIKLTPDKYDEVHRNKRYFATLIGHEVPAVETVIAQDDGFQIVEKHIEPPNPDQIDMALRSINV